MRSFADNVRQLLLLIFTSFRIVFVQGLFICVASHLDYGLPLNLSSPELFTTVFLAVWLVNLLLLLSSDSFLMRFFVIQVDAVHRHQVLLLVPDSCMFWNFKSQQGKMDPSLSRSS